MFKRILDWFRNRPAAAVQDMAPAKPEAPYKLEPPQLKAQVEPVTAAVIESTDAVKPRARRARRTTAKKTK